LIKVLIPRRTGRVCPFVICFHSWSFLTSFPS
jgi:hypothetical protein